MQKYSQGRKDVLHHYKNATVNSYNVSHIDVFYAIYYRPLPLDDNILRQQLEKWFGIVLTHQDFDYVKEMFLKFPPDNTHLVHYLKQKGYTPGHIANYLQVSKVTISYHTAKTIQMEYVNVPFATLVVDKKSKMLEIARGNY